jgi:hypothetical protein
MFKALKNLGKNSRFLIILIFSILFILDYIYGPSILAKITGKEGMYRIGESCYKSREECENIYFNTYLERITRLQKEDKAFFADIFIEDDRYFYEDNCPCPYDIDSAGGSCGDRSSWSKNGQIKYCYVNDVSDDQVEYKREELVENTIDTLSLKVNEHISVYREKYTFLLLLLGLLISLYINKKQKGTKMSLDPAEYEHSGFLQTCQDCKEEYNNETCMDHCPKCSKPFSYSLEQFYFPSKSAYIYNQVCQNCMIHMSAPLADQPCIRCNGPTEDWGRTHISYTSNR